MMKTVRLITCKDAFQANLIKGALENEGIESVLHNENFSNLYRGMSTNFTGVDILVCEDDYEAALRLLERNGMVESRRMLCPRCGSADVKFRLQRRHRIRAFFAVLLSSLSGGSFGTNHWECVCQHCGAVSDAAEAQQEKNKE